MRIIFWNIWGLGKSFRRNWVKEHVLQEELGIVALQETIKQDFSDNELKEMAGPYDFQWIWAPAKGHSGGLITGVRCDEFELEDFSIGDFFLAVLVRNRKSNYRYWVINVYGPAQHSVSDEFIQSLEGFCKGLSLPILMGETSI